jgi:hypothetical protein
MPDWEPVFTTVAKNTSTKVSPKADGKNCAGLVVELVETLIEAAWKAVQMSVLWKQHYEELKKRKGPCKAIVAIARKLLVTIWYVLAREETDRNASEEDLAWKMLLWSWSMGDEARLGLTPKQFAKYSLMRLGVESDVTEFMRGKVLRRIAPTEEVLARVAELGLPA